MEFIKKTELFFIQLNYCLTIEPEPIISTENGNYSLMLKPDVFFKLINDFNIDYPFSHQNKIIELKTLMINENIEVNNALRIVENFKKVYWGFDSITLFEPVIEKFKKTLKKIDKDITEKELNKELFNFHKHLQEKRKEIYISLVNELHPKSNEINRKTKHENIFSNNGFILFEHLLKEYVKPIDKRGRLSDIHFFYWSMFNHKPQLIHQRPERFKDWFFENYNKEDLGKIKTYFQVENPNRKKHFSNALDWFKTQSF